MNEYEVNALLSNPVLNGPVYEVIRRANLDVYANALAWRAVTAALGALPLPDRKAVAAPSPAVVEVAPDDPNQPEESAT